MRTAAMTPAATAALNRRSFLKSAGVLIVGFHSAAEVKGVLAVLEPLGYSWVPILPPPDPASMIGGDYLFRP